MNAPAYIACDWGTSNLRLWLCDADGLVIEGRTGPGVATLRAQGRSDFQACLAEATSGWPAGLSAILCGTIGADIGWQRVPYLACPASPGDIASSAVPVGGAAAAIVRGLSCTNLHGAFDTLRGEETQLLGALRVDPSLLRGERLLCLPGTHTKWAWLDEGRVQGFLSAASGELYAVIQRHSVLVGDSQAAPSVRGFDAALAQLQRHPLAPFPQLAYECRARQLAGEFDAADAAGYLSGLLVGGDVRALLAEGGRPPAPVVLVGEARLCGWYARALQFLGVASQPMEGDACVRSGLHACHLATRRGG